MDSPIVLTNINKAYEKSSATYVIHNLTLSIAKDEFFCLLGPSGCGKSTVLKMIAGIEKPTNGELIKPAHVGMVFQSGALLPWLTVEDNVAFAARMHGFGKEKVLRVTKEYLQMVHLESFLKKYPRELSGGQRQRVGIARALATESNVLLMDEPFSALDPVITDELHKDLLQIWEQTHTTIVMVSHHFEEAVMLADRIGIMKDGSLQTIIPVTLKRPRKEKEKDFVFTVEKIRSIMER
ncbi:MAG TPA: ABC transporter ATP-binding protein [Candidatus Sulfotelmatobacter sp.]|jgi:NitT/TauT family transport system ATP-binding protein|nr:ABC transporter ATP-binding protein [Candidatus Sulfotelmatobacter sp.]